MRARAARITSYNVCYTKLLRIGRFGLQTYANVMSAFAASERLINRTWSASADGYVDEVRTCLALAEDEMRSAQTQLRAARKPA